MRTMLVLRQLAAVLDQKLVAVTRGMKLTPHDVVVMAWLEQRPGISGSQLAYRVGRTRQNIQQSLERLERRGFTERYAGSYRGRSVGWGLTKRGSERWVQIVGCFRVQETMLEGCGVTEHLIRALEDLIKHMVRTPVPTTWGPGLIDIAQEPETPDWDVSGEVELPDQSDEADEPSPGEKVPGADPFSGTY